MSLVEEKPMAAFVLILVGLVVQAALALYVAYFVRMVPYVNYMGMPHMMAWTSMGWFWPVSFVQVTLLSIAIALGLSSLLLIHTSDLTKIRTGGALALAAAILALPMMWSFFAGPLLILIGAILALTWQPSG